MSANICDVSKIQDEDVLRKMWQDTEDFGKKKEIRAHMYKVREARLKDLYTSGTETVSNVQKSSSKSSSVQTHHADSLADHSFLSLKSKEVRDSESPTRDLAFNNKINTTDKYGNSGWTITSSEDTSKDGKTHSATKTATTSGSEKIDKGVSNYAAKAEQKASVYQDGDANNFTRSVGMSDSSQIQQEASGGDENHSFKTTSSSSKSSSKKVTESQSKGGDAIDYSIPTSTVSRDIVPSDAKTVVYTETKTLPDGSKVTTTRYETRGGTSKTTSSSQSSSTVQKSSSSTQQSASSSSEHKSSSKYITNSTGQDKQLKRIDNGVDTVDYNKALKLSEDLARNVNLSTSSTTMEQQIIKDSKALKLSEDLSRNVNVSRSSTTTEQQIMKDSKQSNTVSDIRSDTKVTSTKTIKDRDVCEVRLPLESSPREATPLPKKEAPRREPSVETPRQEVTRKEPEPIKPYEQPERRQPCKPAKTELEVASKATEGQYDTTYRAEFTNKKLHVEVSPTHDAFVRSLRALTPDDLKASSRRNSNHSLRSSQSPDKMRHPSRVSPDRLYGAKSPKRYTSPEKCYEPAKYSPDRSTHYSTDTITRRKKITDDTTRSSSLTRDTTTTKKSRSGSPTTTTSDFEFVSKRKSPLVTDLDDEDNATVTRTTTSTTKTTETTEARPSSLNYSRKTKKITERSPTSPLVDLVPSKRTPSPAKEVSSVRRTSVKEEQQQRHEKILRRSDTYEERCRQILGIPEKKKPERNVSDIISTDRKTYRTSSRDKITQEIAPRKPSLPDAARRPSKSPEKSYQRQSEYSPEKYGPSGVLDKKSPTKEGSKISEFPSQIRRSPERKQYEKYPEKKSLIKDKPTISEFPSQIRKTPEKPSLVKYPERKSPTKESPKISEFPSQIRCSQERESLPKYPERESPVREAPKISEFPSQIRKTPEREPLEKYPEKISPAKEAPTICEFPSQIRKTPEREAPQKYPERISPAKEAPTICEFPSQIRKTPEREAPQTYPERATPEKDAPKISEFPSQIRRSPEREPLEKYPERTSPEREAPKISEFPSQIRRTPEREPLEKIPDRKSPPKEGPKISEFPAPIRKSPEREPIRKYSEKQTPVKDAPTICEFPAQIRRTPEREPLPKYPEKKAPTKESPKISEFPSQVRKSPERESLPQYPEKQKEPKEPSKISEFPAQIRRSPGRDTIPDNRDSVTSTEEVITKKKTKNISEFPSQVKKSPKKTVEDKVLFETTEYLYKDKIPIDEPMFTKKFIAELGSDDECEITVDEHGNTKINTIEDEILIQETQNIHHKTVKKDSPEKQFIREKLSQERETIKHQIDDFINTERNDIYRTTGSRKSSPDLRKSPERGILKHTSQFDEKITTTTETTTHKSTRDKMKKQVIDNKVETLKTKSKTPSNFTTTKKHLIKDTSGTKINITNEASTIKLIKEVKDIKTKPVLSKTPSEKNIETRKPIISKTPTKCAKTCCDIKLETITRTTSSTTKKADKKPEPTVTPKRHIVTTTINVSPKVTKETSSRSIKNITNTQITTKPKTFTMPAKVAKPVTITKKVDLENIENQEKITQKKRIDRIVRTNSDQVVKAPQKTPVRTSLKPELRTKTPEKKCITTKTILINNTVADEREIIVDLLRSTSTREDRNTVCPVKNDAKGTPRYPDQVLEPDDVNVKHIPRKLSTIPIDEYEDVSDFTGVTEVTNEEVIQEETYEDTVDESLLSVNEKVSKFTQNGKPKSLGPARKVERPILIIDEKLESDECLLSVSEKVNKFVNKAEKLSLADIPERPRSPRCQNIVDITDLDENDESLMSVSDKVTHFVTTAENVKKPKASTIKIEKADMTTVDASLKADDCLLSVSDKVTKFITTAETLTTKKDEATKKSTSKRPSKTSDDLTEDCVTIETEEQTYTRTSPQRQTTPKNLDRTSPGRRTSIKEERRNSRKDTSTTSVLVTDVETTPKTSRPTRPILSSTTQLRSTESIRKAKALFENMATGTENREIKRQKEILTRPSVFEGKKKPETIRRLTPDRDDVKLKDIGIKEGTITKSTYSDTRRKLSFPLDDDNTDYKSTKSLLERARTSELDDVSYTTRQRSKSPDNLEVPGYMKPLDRSLRPNSPHRSSVTDIEETVQRTTATIIPEVVEISAPAPASKFGVTLRRTDSGKNFTSTVTSTTTETSTERRRSSNSILKNNEIEDIYELDILEELLESTVGYDIRRRIRAQIRLVKNLISEDKLKIINLKPTKYQSPSREVPETKIFAKRPADSSYTKSPTREVPETRTYSRKPSDTNFTEYQTKYIRKSSADARSINNRLYDHTDLIVNKDKNDKATEYQSSYSRKSSTTKNYLVDSKEKTESKQNTRNKSPAGVKSRETSPDTKPCREKSPEKVRKSPDRKSTTKYLQTDLKKINNNTKSNVDDKPEWITKRALRKITDTPSPVANKYSSTTKTTVTKEIKSSGVKDCKPTDVITSSYGVGPIDENGSPLFGLKALRTQHKEESKVQGTVVRSQFYSENGQEPVGEISVTKYSTDPADLSSDEEVTREDGLLSKTTTQKFGYKGTPAYKSVTDKKQFSEIENENRTNKTTKVTRRGSVKEMSQKFIENTVECLKNERQTYPKAGLILRTSSFKNNSSSSREASPDGHTGTSTMTTVRTTTSKSTSGGSQKGQTFLTNKSKVTGMQDVVSRMQESNKETREGDSVEDTEARSLLNKFLGSQVILAGMEGCSNKATSSRRATTKITTTITEGGKPRTITRTFTHPISAEEIANIWDEETLRLLLEQSSDYDERRIIRARLKEVMAEKEVCADFVDEAITKKAAGTTMAHGTIGKQGESLLLPLLQGLLDAPEVEPMPDSGTESGEDLRSGLIVEVQSALDKLSACLCNDTTDITSERRESLLQLVSKLQANLATTTTNNTKNSERRSSGGSRFNKRRQRQNRHTIGVTSEELEDARRLMEEYTSREVNPLQKQNSESAVQRNVASSAYKPVKFQPHKPLVIKNATAKPYNGSNNSSVNSGASSTVDTPTEPSESLDLLFSETPIKSPQAIDDSKYIYRQSVSLDQNEDPVTTHYRKPLLHQTMSLDYNSVRDLDLMAIHQAVQQAAATKQLKSDQLGIDSETDEDPSTIKANPQLNSVDLFHHAIPNAREVNQQPDLLLQSNPLFVCRDDSSSSIDKENRFNSKKLKMKRANTIDIPKPMKCYVDENESEDELENRRNTYLQLRGPLNVGKFNNKVVPSFDPKTESDKKFMAFINRQNNEKTNSMVKTSIWDNHQSEPIGHGSAANWHRKFGNIKTTFERSSSTESNSSAPASSNTARSFWKSADDSRSAGVLTYNGPKISKQSARNLQQMFDEKQKQAKSMPWAGESNHNNIVKGSLKVDAKIFEQSKNNKFSNHAPSVNMFSHAPMSAFQPIHKTTTQISVVVPSTKTPPSNFVTTSTKPQKQSSFVSSSVDHSMEPPTPTDAPLFLYSPKPFSHEANSYSSVSSAVSPTIKSTPWNQQTTNEHRVKNIAVAKFEATDPVPVTVPVTTRKKSTDNGLMPKYLQQNADKERDKAPTNYISYSTATNPITKNGGSVHKMSGKYNVLSEKPDPVLHHSTQKHQSAFATVPQSQKYQQPSIQQLPYTHSITYSQPKIPYNNQYYSQVDEVPKTKPEPKVYTYQQPKIESRSYHQPAPKQHIYNHKFNEPETNKPNTYKYQAPKVESHVVYNNVHRVPQTNYVSRQSVVEKEQPQAKPTSAKSPYYQNGPYNQHLPAVETFVSSVSPPQMHYNELYRNLSNDSTSPVQEKHFSPPQSPPEARVPKYESQTSQESVHEYNAVSSRVMTGPVSQQAVNVNQNGPKNRNQHDLDAAFTLKSTLQKLDKNRIDKSPTPPKRQHHTTITIMPNVMVNDKPLESLEINERGETIVTSKFQIPVKAKPEIRPSPGQVLSKSDSWHKVCQSGNLSTPNKPSPRSSPNARTVTKSKSTHTLALPKQFEAGMSRDEMAHKKMTMEAYFAGSKSPQLTTNKVSASTAAAKSTINRTKTSQKMSVMRQTSNSGLSRSRTLPDIVCADLLDESNVDEAFEDLFKAKSFETTKQSFTEGPVTTSQVSTTKVTSQQQISKKPMSPFAKFRQLDRANSLNTPPSTPKTPTGGAGAGPLFKFTDPQLSRSASTIKERLLQWCQMKTKEYENIQLDNFSGSWADGLAFCALIHHFLPDAFDYTKLTSNNRRYNFTLAFQIADEKADIAPLLDVEDMVATRRPDWKCVFTYVQSIYRRFKDED